MTVRRFDFRLSSRLFAPGRYVAGMTRWLFVFVAIAIFCAGSSGAAEVPAVEQQVLEAVKSRQTTIVHLWAPWCSNCKAELSAGGWSKFLAAHPDVRVIFVTVWDGGRGDGRAMLEQYGVGQQPNFTLYLHPNGSRKSDERMTRFLGLPVTWIPTTWIFRGGTLCYALNYGELRFPMLDQLVRDASTEW